jgi:hemoglobin
MVPGVEQHDSSTQCCRDSSGLPTSWNDFADRASSGVNRHGDRRWRQKEADVSRDQVGGSAMRVDFSRVSTAVLVTAVTLIAASPTRTAMAQVKEPSLYERLGGVYSIATVVDDFIERLLVNATLNANPAIKEARARVPKAGLKFHVTALVCAATGGSCTYTGRPMKESHGKLNISQAEWDAMVADFTATLNKFKVPQREQQELITIVGSTKNDIVRSPSSGQR